MKLKRLLFPFFACIAVGVFFLQCTRCTPLTDRQFNEPVTLVTYNTQTFFDAVEDGTEFKEYKGSKSRWTAQKYKARLERLKGTMFTAGEKLTGKKDRLPDIVILQEVESNRVIEDFCKQLPSGENYPYAVCPPHSEKGAFSTVILSKYPVEHYVVHRLQTEKKVSLRPLIEVVLNTGSKEFNQLSDFPVCWNVSSYRTENEAGAQPNGSYYFKNSWEKIDHIFYESGTSDYEVSENASDTGQAYIEPLLFFVLYEPPLIEDGKPVRYNVLTGEGYSDHLPLGFRFEIHD